MAESLLEPAFLTQLEYLYLVARELFLGHSSGRMSRRFGVGLEFADYRNYAPGDDIRYIDWAALARSDAALIKLFSEEHSAEIYLVIDASLSMATGTPEKLLYAKKIAAALGYIGLANQDSVHVLCFDAVLRNQARRFEGRGQVNAMLSHLDRIYPDAGFTSLTDTFQRFVMRYGDRRGLVVILSDFLDSGFTDALRILHYHHFDLLAIQINDRQEVDPSTLGDVELVDSESGHVVTMRLTPDTIAAYRKRATEHYDQLAQMCKLMKRNHAAVVTDQPLRDVVLEVFRRAGFLR